MSRGEKKKKKCRPISRVMADNQPLVVEYPVRRLARRVTSKTVVERQPKEVSTPTRCRLRGITWCYVAENGDSHVPAEDHAAEPPGAAILFNVVRSRR